MRITESRLRRIIRNILKESASKNSRGNIDLSKRGKEISESEARSLKYDFIPDHGIIAGEQEADKLIELLKGKQINTNEIVISPDSVEDIKWANKNESKALIPLFVIEDSDLKSEINIIVFKEAGSNTHYKLRLDGESFVDKSAPGYHGTDPREIHYSDDIKAITKRGNKYGKPNLDHLDRLSIERSEEKARQKDMMDRGRF